MSVYTSSRPTTDHGSRFLAKPTLIVLHHAATTNLEALLQLMQPGGRTVSAHAAIGGREIVSVVPEARRSYSLGAAIFERRVLSAECVNAMLAPSWSLSADTHESIARWVADVSRRWGIRPHREGPASSWTVLGHREVYTVHGAGYATACPGGMDLDRIVRRAQQLLSLPEENEEGIDDVKLIKRGEGSPEWSLFHPTLRGATELERGYIITTDPEVARDWARTWANGQGSEKVEPRANYVAMQASARLTYAAHESAMLAALATVKVPGSPGSVPTAEQVADATADELARRLTS